MNKIKQLLTKNFMIKYQKSNTYFLQGNKWIRKINQ